MVENVGSIADRLDEIILSYLQAVDAGVAVDRNEILAKNPGLAAELAEFFAGESWLKPRLAGAAKERPSNQPTISFGPAQTSPQPDEPFNSPPMPTFPGYEILGVLGRGGMGVVYKARDLKLKRVVALKMILAGDYAGEEERARFKSEAETVARLQHPGIVQIFEVGEHVGHRYCVLEFIDGGSLAQKLATQAISPVAAAMLVEALARAMQLAHSRNVVHRDLKPANVLLTADGTPKVTDFGLARQLDTDSGQTQAGAVMGTPSYMAPEQASGRAHAAGPAADLYALGAILYECLAGRPPFQGATVGDVLDQVRTRAPAPLSRGREKVPRDLETICLKCLRKEPEKRYASAAELAEELGRYLRGEPIVARPVGAVEFTAMWMRRHKGFSAGLAAAVLAVILGTSVATWQAMEAWTATGIGAKLKIALDETEEQRTEAGKQRNRFEDLERSTRYRRDIGLGKQAWQDARLGQTLRLLGQWQPARIGDPDLRGWEWYYLRGLCHKDFRTLGADGTGGSCVAFHPDNRRVAIGAWTKQVQIWDVHTGSLIHTLKGHTDRVDDVTFSPTGGQLVSVGGDGTLRFWDTESGQELRKYAFTTPLRSVAFSHDGEVLAIAGNDSTVILLDAASGLPKNRLRGHQGHVFSAKFSPDDRFLASAGLDRTAILWDVASGKIVRAFHGHTAQVSSVAFSTDGHTLATSSEDFKVKLWDWTTGKLEATLEGHTAWVFRVAFSPDGRSLASASDDMTVRLWDIASRQQAQVLRGHVGACVRGLAYRPDGALLASATLSKETKIWELKSGPQEFCLLRHGNANRVMGLSFSGDGRCLASGGQDCTVRLQDTVATANVRILKGHQSEVSCVAFGPGDKLLASSDLGGAVRLWDPEAATGLGLLVGHKGAVHSVAFTPDGRWLASAGQDQTVIVWDLALREKHQILPHKDNVLCVAFSLDGRYLAAACSDNTVKLWDAKSWKELRTFTGFKRAVGIVTFSPDSAKVATGGVDGEDGIQLWDAASGELLRTFEGLWGNVNGLTFSPDGRRLAAGGSDRKVMIWDTTSAQEVLTLQGPKIHIYSLCFSRDGRWLAAAGSELTGPNPICLWEAPLVDPAKPKKSTNSVLPPLDPAWLKAVASMPAKEQLHAVAEMLKQLNPGFDGEVIPKIENDVVTQLQFSTLKVKDISPVQALSQLQILQCSGIHGGERGQLADLSPLKNMKLIGLLCHDTQVSDLSPLQDMNLHYLGCNNTQVSNLWPLKGMPMVHLWCGGTRVSNLAPLKGMPLTWLSCWHTPVSDLTPLKGMNLTGVECAHTNVDNLRPLQDMMLTLLDCDYTQVADLAPLKGMKLKTLGCYRTNVSDLSLLKEMPLTDVRIDFDHMRDAEILRSIATLEKINGKNTKESLKKMDAK